MLALLFFLIFFCNILLHCSCSCCKKFVFILNFACTYKFANLNINTKFIMTLTLWLTLFFIYICSYCCCCYYCNKPYYLLFFFFILYNLPFLQFSLFLLKLLCCSCWNIILTWFLFLPLHCILKNFKYFY